MTIWEHFKYLMRDEGGWISAALGVAGLLGSLFGKQAEGAAQGRQIEGQQLLGQDALRNQQYDTAQDAQMQAGNLDLQRKSFTEQARGNRAKQAALADLLMGFQPSRVSVPGVASANLSGGLGLGEGGKAGMAELLKQALAAQLQGDTFEGGKTLPPPPLSMMPKASGWEKLAGILGIGGQIAGGLGAAGLGAQAPTPYLAQKPPEGLNPKIYEGLFGG